jgi:hypothetical protein
MGLTERRRSQPLTALSGSAVWDGTGGPRPQRAGHASRDGLGCLSWLEKDGKLRYVERDAVLLGTPARAYELRWP